MTTTRRTWMAALVGAMAMIGCIGRAEAAEIKLLGSIAMREAMPGIIAAFETASGHKVAVELTTVGAISERLGKGEAADVAIVSPAQSETLRKAGRLVEGSQVVFARNSYAAFVKVGAPMPVLGSADEFKAALLAAKSLTMGDPAGGGVSGVYLAGLIGKLGIADEIKGKTRLFPSASSSAKAVAAGEIEFGLGVATDTVITPGLTAVPLPKDIQSYTVYSLALVTGSAEPDAGKALIQFINSPASKQALAAKGFEPQ